MKNLKKVLFTAIYIISILVIIAITTKLTIQIFDTTVYADVGSFEDYGGDFDWGGSSWDSDWGSSSWDSDYSGGGDFIFFFGDGFGFLIFIIIIIISAIVTASKKKGPMHRTNPSNYRVPYPPSSSAQDEARQKQIENIIQAEDQYFNANEFISFSKNLFVKLQQAWTDRDWSTIRTFETESLFEQHKSQLQGYINNNQINVMDRICVNYAYLYQYTKQGDKEILVVKLNSRMADYIIDATTQKVLKGDKQTERVNTYMLTFIRKYGVKTKPGTIEINTTNCPNCGAPTQITSSGKCDYCGSVITTGEYNWALSNLERARNY